MIGAGSYDMGDVVQLKNFKVYVTILVSCPSCGEAVEAEVDKHSDIWICKNCGEVINLNEEV
jgi:ribosomal protein L37AE/L43A